MKIERFEDIQAWQEARRLAGMLAEVARSRSFSRDRTLKEEINRTAISIMANIAEGFESQSDGEFTRFLVYARRSAAELQSHLYLALDRGLLPSRDFQKLYTKLEEIRALIGGFVRYLSRPARTGGRGAVEGTQRTADRGPATGDRGLV